MTDRTQHKQALWEALTPDEAKQLTAHLHPLVESGQGTGRSALAPVGDQT